MALTPFHFVSQLFATGLIMSNDSKRANDQDITERTLVKIREYTQFLCEVVCEHYPIVSKFPPSKVANVCFYFARKCCNLRNVWGEDMQEYTGYTLSSMQDAIQEFQACTEIDQLIKFAMNNFREGARAAYLNNLKT
jgi:hypothetical protein